MDQVTFSDHSTKYNRQNQSRESLEQAQSRASWASSTGYWGEDSEGDTGTIKRRGGKDVTIEAESSSIASVTTEETKPVPMPAHRAVTPSAAKGLVGKCETWPAVAHLNRGFEYSEIKSLCVFSLFPQIIHSLLLLVELVFGVLFIFFFWWFELRASRF
jgi:hypothetical protein